MKRHRGRAAVWAGLVLCSCDVDAGQPRLADARVSDDLPPGARVNLPGGPGVVGTRHKLTVAVLFRRGAPSPLSEVQVRDLFEGIRGLAITRNGPPDISCCLDLAVLDEVRFIEVDDLALVRPATRKEREALRNKNYATVVIVDRLDWCGVVNPEPENPKKAFYGCNDRDRQVIELRYDSADRSLLHELGHVRGLDHRRDDDPLCQGEPAPDESRLPRAVMCRTFAGGRLNQAECDALMNRDWVSAPGAEAGAVPCEHFGLEP